MVANPFSNGASGVFPDDGKLMARRNVYYRLFGVRNLM
jgi:hypothetical protein